MSPPPSHLPANANAKPAIPPGPAVLYLDNHVHLVGVGIGALEAALFGGVVDEDKRCARVHLAQSVHIFDLQSGFGDKVYEYKIRLPGVFGHAVGHVQARVRGFKAGHFLLECVAEPLLDGAILHFAVVNCVN